MLFSILQLASLQLGLFLLPVQALAGPDDIRIGYVFSDGQMPITVSAYRQLLEERPDLKNKISITILTESTFDEINPEELMSVDVLVYDVMNEQMVARFDQQHSASLIAQVDEGGTVIGVGQGLMSQQQYAAAGVHWNDTARQFWAGSGLANQLGLLKYALQKAGVDSLEVPEPQTTFSGGYYYPTEGGGQVFATWSDFDTWRKANDKHRKGAPRIAIGFYRANYYSDEMAIVDALIAQIEARGAEAIPYFGYPGHVATHQYLLDEQGQSRADVVLAFLFRFAQPDSAELLSGLDAPIINLVTLYGRSQAQWQASSTGLSLFEGTFQIAVPELAGLIAPTVVGSREKTLEASTGLSVILQTPISSRVERAVSRALKIARLRAMRNADKKLALIYYNYPAGASTIGASYLNAVDSLANILNRLSDAGYDVGGRRFDGDQLLQTLTQRGVNIAGYAPGELAQFVQQDNLVRVPLPQYEQWSRELDPTFYAKVIEDWGPAANARLMAQGGEQPGFVIPALRFGNVVVMPQPIRGWGEDDAKLYHAEDLAPHHQYVAVYQWLQHDLDVDAIVHLGTHGTLEWLDGKDTGLSDADAPEALISDIPHFYVYNVDVVGEGLVARRRSAATLIDHMVPPFVKGGIYAELAELSDRIDSYQVNLTKNPQLAAVYAGNIRQAVKDLDIEEVLALDSSNSAPGDAISDEVLHAIGDYIEKLKQQNIPYGMHTFGHLPTLEQRASTVDAIVSVDLSLSEGDAQAFAAQMDGDIVRSATRELDNLLHGLSGGYIPGGTGGEPIRNPDAYPTGKNFYGIDPDKVPTKAAWKIGVELAQQLVAARFATHGTYPEKLSFVIWGDETMRHEGILESQIFWFLGVRPVWDVRDKVVDVEVIPEDELGRPRVDIVIASAAEGMFHNVTVLMDKAVQLVKVLDEENNFVREHYLAVKKELIALGYSNKQADLRASVRIFDEAPGTYNLNVSRIVEASGTWDNDLSMAHDYTRKMGHGFGNGFWGEPMEDVFRLTLRGTQMVVHSSSTMLYGALDNDDFYMYMGGLANVVKNLDGVAPQMMVTNTRDVSRPEMSTINEFLDTELRSRYFNPRWIEGMQSEGYAGAGEMRSFVEYLWGWDAITSDTVDDRDWNEVFAVYVEDKHGLDMQAFFDQASPFAYQDMTTRMLEVVRKGYWNASVEIRHTLAREYLNSVERHGVSCSQNTCGNPRLLQYLLEQARAAGVAETQLQEFQANIEQKMGGTIADKALQQETFARNNEAKIRRRNAMLEDGMDPELIDQYEIDAGQTQAADNSPTTSSARMVDVSSYIQIIAAVALFALLILFVRQRFRKHH